MSTKTDDELNSLVKKYLTSLIVTSYGKFNDYFLPITYHQICKDIEDLEVYDDDIWVCSYPKSGTTWMQEMVWCICNNLDFEAANEDLDTRFVFLEFSNLFDFDDTICQPDIFTKSIDMVKNMNRPRFIKTHLPWELLPKQIKFFEKRPKIIHVARNPMDTCVSYYHFCKLLGTYTGELDTFIELFLNHKVTYSPYHKNVLGYWYRRNEPNILFIKFEDMRAELSIVVETVAKFLNITLTKEGNTKLVSHIGFDSMKKNQSVVHSSIIDGIQKNNVTYDQNGKFMRSGKSGAYRSEMQEETIDLFKTQFIDKMEDAGLKF